ncbi:MAG: acetate--CoA ligase family protein [Alphaproteobacteria bacterium]|nr:acetate--CoA ligase family protein [Alphaproteobacteria bacterium]
MTGGTTEPGSQSLEPLFYPRSIAIIGASADPARISGKPIESLKAASFAGPIYPVNPRHQEVQGLACYPHIDAVPGPVDLVLVTVPAAGVVNALEASARKGARSAVIFSSGFAEVSESGAVAQARMSEIAATSGMRILGPNCMGLFNVRHKSYVTFSSAFLRAWPKPGPIAIISQSGAFGAHCFVMARERGFGLSHWVTTGNECDVDCAEALAYMADDADTGVILAYIEGTRRGDLLIDAFARARTNRKPVILMKVGRSTVGAEAAKSHTATLAGDDAVYDAVFRDLGVHRARTFQELFDTAKACAMGKFPRRGRVGIVTISGGGGILMADAAAEIGLDVPPMPEEAQRKLKKLLPYASPRNPVDTTAQALDDMSLAQRNLEIMLEEGDFDAIACFFASVGLSPQVGPKLRDAVIAACRGHSATPVLMAMAATPELIAELAAAGIAHFEDPVAAIEAIGALVRFGRAFERKLATPPALPAPRPAPSAGMLDEAASKALLGGAGIEFLADRLVRSADEAVAAAEMLGLPVALKLLSPDIAHKTEVGGVALGLNSPDAVVRAFDEMMMRVRTERPEARITGALVAPMITGGTEMMLGVQRDPVFGPAIMVGMGGIYAEVLRDVAFRLAPFGTDDAHELIGRLRGYPVLAGARGQARLDIDGLASALSRLSLFAAANAAWLDSVDINPIIVTPKSAVAVDALVVARLVNPDQRAHQRRHIQR